MRESLGRVGRWALSGVVIALASAGPARADGRAFTDSRDRFKLQLPGGWELTPMPGDTEGMVFRRKSGAVPAIVSVKVAVSSAADTHTSVMDKRGKPFEREIGYEKLGDGEVRLGEFRALRRVHTVFLNGDSELKRYSVDHVILAYGHGHYIHFETADGHYNEFSRDLDAILRSYVPIVGRTQYAPLVGRWAPVSSSDGQELVFGADQVFQMGSRQGLYRVDGKRLSLVEPLGTEQYRYLVDDGVLTIHNDQLKEPLSFKRAAAGPRLSTASDDEKAAADRRALKITPAVVVGVWVVVEGGDAFEMMLSEGGAFRFGPMSGRYSLRENLMTVEHATGTRVTYHLAFDGKRLRMTGGDLDKALIMERRQ